MILYLFKQKIKLNISIKQLAIKTMRIPKFKWLKETIIITAVLFSAVVIFSSCGDDDDENDDDNNNNSGYCFDFAKTSVAYTELTGATDVSTGNEDDYIEIDLGFSIQHCDTSFSKIYIINGLYFSSFLNCYNDSGDPISGYELYPFGFMEMGAYYDENLGEYTTKILTKTTGTSGNKITSIEFRNLEYHGIDVELGQVATFTMKFYENGNKIVFHYGPSTIDYDFGADPFNEFFPGFVGKTSVLGIFLAGDPDAPTTTPTNVPGLDHWPAEGTVYTFYQ